MPIEGPKRWQAEWIAPAGAEQPAATYFYARSRFSWQPGSAPGRLHITAESFYRLWVNGHELAFGPARGNQGVNFFDTLELADWLRPGDNFLAVWVFATRVHNHLASLHRPGLLCQLDEGAYMASGYGWQVKMAEAWECESEPWANKLGLVESYDARKAPVGWEAFQDPGEWEAATVVGEALQFGGKQLFPRDIPSLAEMHYLPTNLLYAALVPKATEPGEVGARLQAEPHIKFPLAGVGLALCQGEVARLPVPGAGQGIALLIDFRREISGGFCLDLSAPEGTILEVGYDEVLDERGRLKITHFGNHHFCGRYVIAKGRQMVRDARNQMGYRYLLLVFRQLSGPLTLHRLEALDRRYPYTQRGSFRSSDPLLDQIWTACLETLSACTSDTFMDCPWRERALWINDMIVTGLTAQQAFGDARIVRHCLLLAHGGRKVHGLIPAIIPATDWPRHILVPTSLYFLLELYYYWLYSGDDATLGEILPGMVENYRFFETWEDEYHHLLPPKEYWNFFEWSYESCGLSLDGKVTANLNWLYAWCLRVLAQLLRSQGRASEAAQYEAKVPKIVAGMKARFQLGEGGAYADWLEADGQQSAMVSQLSHAMAILSGALSPQEEQALGSKALFNPDFHQPELFMSHFSFLATERVGQGEQALDKIRRLWGGIVASGSTTIWENAIYELGRKFASGSGSLCHAFSTAPVSFFQRSLLGIRPTAPGFSTFTVDPGLFGLDFVEGEVPTPHGNIRINCEARGDGVQVTLVVPEGTQGYCRGKAYPPGDHSLYLNSSTFGV